MDIIIKKIKAQKGKLVFEYDKKEGNTPISTHKSTFEEEPEPSFWLALGYLRVDVCRILEVDPGQFAIRIIPMGVSYSTDASGRDAAIITFEYHMPNSMTTTTINTPLLRLMDVNEEEMQPRYFDDREYLPAPPFYCDVPTSAHLRILQNEAVRYLEGHRGQGGLFDDAEAQEPNNVTLKERTDSDSQVPRIAG